MGLVGALQGRAPETDPGVADDQGRPLPFGPGLFQDLGQRDLVVPVHLQHIPAIPLEALADILAVSQFGVPLDGDVVAVVKTDQLVQAEMPGDGKRLVRDPFHEVAVAAFEIGVMVHDGMPGPVEPLGQHRLRQRHAHRIGAPLAQRAGRGLNPRRVAILRVAGRTAAPLPELLQLLQGKIIAAYMQQAVEQHGAMATGLHIAVAIRPGRVGGIVLEELEEQHRGKIRHAHGHARMTGIRFLYTIHGQSAEGMGNQLKVHKGPISMLVFRVERKRRSRSRQQALDLGPQLLGRNRSGVVQAQLALPIVDQPGGYGAHHAVTRQGGAGGCDQRVVSTQRVPILLRSSIHHHAHNRQAGCPELPMQLVQLGHQRGARRRPRRTEIEHHHLALEGHQVKAAALAGQINRHRIRNHRRNRTGFLHPY